MPQDFRLHNVETIGVELEGGWDDEPETDIYGDGSVNVEGDFGSGEIQSPGLTWDRLKNWIATNYPQRVNSSCGFHIHVKMTTLGAYMGTMEQGFCTFLKKKLRQFGIKENIPRSDSFWLRLEGRNTYCRDEFRAAVQAAARAKTSERYTMINWCYRLHGTIEFRVLPMFANAEMAIKAAETILLALAAYSRKKKHGEKILDTKIQIRKPNEDGGGTICV